MLIVTGASLAHYEALTRRLFLTNPNVKRFRSSTASAPMRRSSLWQAAPISGRYSAFSYSRPGWSQRS
jgi:hypothetical protein